MKQLLAFAKHYGPLIGTLATLITCFSILTEMRHKSQSQLKSEVELLYEHKQRINDILLRIAAMDAKPSKGRYLSPTPQELLAFYMLNDFDRFYKLSLSGNFSPCVWRDTQDMIYTQLKVDGPYRPFWNKVAPKGMYDSEFHEFITKLTRMNYRPVYQYNGMHQCNDNDSKQAGKPGSPFFNPMDLLRASLN
jgi:hypothetical protein